MLIIFIIGQGQNEIIGRDTIRFREPFYAYGVQSCRRASYTMKSEIMQVAFNLLIYLNREAQVSVSDPSKDDLTAKLAAAEAEAEALRRELATWRGSTAGDPSKFKPAVPDKRIDGIGYRETLFSAPGQAIGNCI
eukprot:Gb_03858 [translate_table: standard]